MQLTEQEEYLIKRRRKQLKLSDVASAIGCSITVFSKWEKGTENAVTPKTKELVEEYKNYIDNYKN